MGGLHYVPYHQLGDRANAIVDGSGNEHTKLELSHWPGNATPAEFKADLSAEIVFNFLETGTMPGGVEVASNNHFDEDGLVSLYALLNPDEALSNKEFLIEVARAGDFGTTEDRDAAHVAFVVNAWTDVDRSPLNRTAFSGTHDELSAVLYEELLDRFPNIVEKIHYFEEFWSADETFLEQTEAAMKKGTIEIDQYKDVDLAIVTIPIGGIIEPKFAPAHAASWASSVCHTMAVHNAIDCHRVLIMQGRHYQFYYRYETWVEYISRSLAPRVDLTGLAERMTKMERGGKRWKFSGVDDIIGRLNLPDNRESDLSPNEVTKLLKDELAQK